MAKVIFGKSPFKEDITVIFMSGSTIRFYNKPSIIATSTIAGPKEAEGNIGKYIEKKVNDDEAKRLTENEEKPQIKMAEAVSDTKEDTQAVKNNVEDIKESCINSVFLRSYNLNKCL